MSLERWGSSRWGSTGFFTAGSCSEPFWWKWRNQGCEREAHLRDSVRLTFRILTVPWLPKGLRPKLKSSSLSLPSPLRTGCLFHSPRSTPHIPVSFPSSRYDYRSQSFIFTAASTGETLISVSFSNFQGLKLPYLESIILPGTSPGWLVGGVWERDCDWPSLGQVLTLEPIKCSQGCRGGTEQSGCSLSSYRKVRMGKGTFRRAKETGETM